MSFKQLDMDFRDRGADVHNSWSPRQHRLDSARNKKTIQEMHNLSRDTSFRTSILFGFGLECNDVQKDLYSFIDACIEDENFDFVLVKLNRPDQSNGQVKFIPDIALPSDIWKTRVALDLGFPNLDSPFNNDVELFEQLLNHALYLMTPIISIGCPRTEFGCLTLASIINNRISNLFKSSKFPHFIFRVPFSYEQLAIDNEKLFSCNIDQANIHNGVVLKMKNVNINGIKTMDKSFRDKSPELIQICNCGENDAVKNDCCSPWTHWNRLRSYLTPDTRVGVDIIINDNLPDIVERTKWCGEPVKLITITEDQFISDNKGEPLLPIATHHFVTQVSRSNSIRLSYLLSCAKKGSYDDYVRFFNRFRKSLYKSIKIPEFLNYEDYLQVPLQPLSSNLESSTYEVFETDTVKYTKYCEAMTLALKKIARDKFTLHDNQTVIPKSARATQRLVVMIVGAGRGPLVDSCIEAIKLSKVESHPRIFIKIYAIEKNPSSILTMKEKKKIDWLGSKSKYSVEIVKTDMRNWKAPEKADLVVSELLGSFSDNELSPECIDGVAKYCKDDTISIPQSYSSYIAPISSYKLLQEICSQNVPTEYPFDTIYVVQLKNHYIIDTPQKLFTFDHFKLNVQPSERNNMRYSHNVFRTSVDTVCHGFGAYFDAQLFDNVKISTVPGSHTPDMHSWFPAFVPLDRPVVLSKDSDISIHFWRKQSSTQVWYEWVFTKPQQLRIQSADGKGTAMSKFLL